MAYSCRKDTDSNSTLHEVADFWAYTQKNNKNITVSTDSSNQALLPLAVQDLKSMKDTKILQKYILKLGLPAWDASTEFTDADGVKTLLVPIVNQEKKSVTALLVVNYINNYSYYKYNVVVRDKKPTTRVKNRTKIISAIELNQLFAALDKELLGVGNSTGFSKNTDKGRATTKVWVLMPTGGYCVTVSAGGHEYTSCTYTYSWVWLVDSGSDGGSEEGGGYSSGGGSGGSPTTTYSATNFIAAAPINAINLQQRLDCFNTVPTNSSTTYKMTIHVHSARQGHPSQEFNLTTGDPGHAYITLEKVNGSNVQRLSFGFYPKYSSLVTPTKQPVVSGIGEEHSNPLRRSDIRYSLNLNETAFNNAVNSAASNSSNSYSLSDYNCTDYAIAVFNAGVSSTQQLNVPNSNITGFTTPGALYSTLNQMKNTANSNVTDGSTSPPPSTNCN